MKRSSIMKIGSLLAWLAGGNAAMGLVAGGQAPDLDVPWTGGGTVNLRTLDANWKVLFFFPKAFTPGCTSQACSMRDATQDLRDLGVTVLGASTDSLKTQQEFKEKHNLSYELLADEEKSLAEAFDVLGLFGLTKRVTFIINPEGIITDRLDSVSVGSHDQDVLGLLREHLGKE